MSKYQSIFPRLTLSPYDIHLQIYQLYNYTITLYRGKEREQSQLRPHSLQCYKLCCLNFHVVEIKMSCKINYTKIKTQPSKCDDFTSGISSGTRPIQDRALIWQSPALLLLLSQWRCMTMVMMFDDDVCLSYWSPALMTRTGLLSQSVVAAAAVFVFILITPSQCPFVTFYFLLQTISL